MNRSAVRQDDEAPARCAGDRVRRGGAPAPGAALTPSPPRPHSDPTLTPPRPHPGPARRSSLLAALLLAACTTTTTVTYVPSPEQPRLDLVRGQATLARFVGLECERLRGEGHAAGETQVTVALDDAGLATGAELAASSGDARIDGIIGAVAAQLALQPPAAGVHAAMLRATYRCTDDGGVSATLAPP